MSRRGSGSSGSSNRGRPRRIPQFPQRKPEAPPPTTPFQPGASSSPPLGLFLAIPIGLVLLGKFLWDLFNQRPKPEIQQPTPGTFLRAYAVGNGPFAFGFQRRSRTSQTRSCDPPGLNFEPPTDTTSNEEYGVFGSGIRIGSLRSTAVALCGTGTNFGGTPTPALTIVQANGVFQDFIALNPGAVFYTSFFNRQNESSVQISGVYIRVGGVTTFAEQEVAGVETLPRPQAQLIPVPVPIAPAVAPTAPAPETAPPTVPDSQPVPAPAAVPGGLPGGAAVAPVLSQALGVIRRTFQRATPGSQPQQITATGVSAPPRLPVPQTGSGLTFIPGLPPLAPNGPAPTMQGIAGELGKLETKLELLLAPEGPRSLLENINRVIDQIENIKFVLDNLFPPEPYTFAGGAYELTPVCDRDSEGVLLPPRTAAWAGGQGEVAEVRNRIDALAQLIQHHKDLKQPTCGPRGNGPGSNVTVHFESD